MIIWKNIFSCKKRSDVTPLIPSSREGTDKERDRSRKKRGERFHNELVPRGGQFLALTFSLGWSAASHSSATIYVVSIIGLPEFFCAGLTLQRKVLLPLLLMLTHMRSRSQRIEVLPARCSHRLWIFRQSRCKLPVHLAWSPQMHTVLGKTWWRRVPPCRIAAVDAIAVTELKIEE